MRIPRKFEHVELLMNEDTLKWIEQERAKSRWNWFWWLVVLVLVCVAVLFAIAAVCFWREQ